MLRRYGILVVIMIAAALALMGFVRSDNTDVVQGNVDIALNLIDEVWNQGNLARVPDFYAPGTVWHSPRGTAALGELPCACAFELFDVLSEDYIGMSLKVENVVAQDDFVVAHYTWEGKPRGWMYDSVIESPGDLWSGVLMYRFENGKVAEEWWYWDNALIH